MYCSSSGFRAAFGVVLSAILLPAIASAQMWNGGGADNNWNTGGNWLGGFPPSNLGISAVQFGGTTRLTPIVNANNPWSIGSITFNFLAAANAFSISGNALTIGTGGITNNDNDVETFNNNINTNGSQIWNASGNGMSFTGNVTIATGNTLTLTSSSSSIVLGGSVFGGNGLIKSGAGGLTLNGASDDPGLFLAANAGTVSLAKASSPTVHAIGSDGLLTIGGATVQLANIGGDQISDNASVTINSGSLDLNSRNEVIGALNGLAAGIITNNSLVGTSTLTVNLGGNFAGVIQNGSALGVTALTVNGPAPLILTGANTYTGGTTILGGATLQLGNGTTSNGFIVGSISDGGVLVFSNPNLQAYNGTITGSGALTKTGAGTLILNSGPSNYGGGTAIIGGAVVVQFGGSLTKQGTMQIGTSGVDGQNGVLTVDATGVVSQSGSAGVTVGAPSATTGTLNIGMTGNGATFSIATGGLGIFPNSSVNIGSGAVTGTLTSNGGVVVEGVLQTANSGSVFSLAAGQPLSVRFGGRASFTGNYSTNDGSYLVTGTGSKLETLAGGVFGVVNGASVSVQLGGLLNSTGALNVGTSGNGTIVVDGSGSKLTVASFTSIADNGSTGSVTLQNGSNGNTFGEVRIANSAFDGSTGSMSVLSGATATFGNLSLLFAVDQGNPFLSIGQSATFTVDGAGSTVTLNPGAALSIGQDQINPGILTVSNNGSFTVGVGGSTVLNSTGVININGGTVDLKTLTRTGSGGTVNFTAGSLSFIGSFNVGVGGLLGQSLTIDPSKSLTLTGSTTIDQFKTLTLSGGTLNTGSLVVNGTLVFNSGTLGITGGSGLTISSSGPFGPSLALGAAHTLNVSNTASIQGGATLAIDDGGTISAGAYSNQGTILLRGATGVVSGGTLTNAGIIRGDGSIAAGVTNAGAGEIRAESGKTLNVQGVNGANAGKINLQGGTIQFSQPLTNTGNGLIDGRGTLIVGGTGLLNQATVALSGGITDVFGKVNNSTGDGSKGITVSGNADVTFWDDVTNTSGLFKVATGSSATFFGTFGGGGTTGGGQINMEADVTPGFSPAAVTFGGNLTFDSTSTLHIDIGGTTPGSGPNNHDQVNVTGSASLGGTLDLVPFNGFVPVAGDKFVVMTYASATGTFSSVTGTAPAPGLAYTPVYSPTNLTILTTTTGEKTWGVDASGNSSLGANWMGGIAPGGIGDSATFSTIITAPRIVTLDADTTVGTLKFDSPKSYLIAGQHTLTLQAAGATAAAMNISGVHGNGAHTISAPITLASDLNITQNSGGLFTLSGALDDAAGKQINVTGSGTTAITGSVNLGNATSLSVGGTGSLRFGLTTAAATIGTGVTATINNAATLELAGSVSALSSGTNRVNITNGSNAAAGILVSGTNQQVGGIDGSGTTQVNAGSDLRADHVIQGALVIGGTAGNPALVTIDASDATGTPLGQPSGLALARSSVPSRPFDDGVITSANLSSVAAVDTDLTPFSDGNSDVIGIASQVPEPSTLLLAFLAIFGVISTQLVRHHFRCQAV